MATLNNTSLQTILNLNETASYDVLCASHNLIDLKEWTVRFTLDEYDDSFWIEMFDTPDAAKKAASVFLMNHDDNYSSASVYETNVKRYQGFGDTDENMYNICEIFNSNATFKIAVADGVIFTEGDIWNIKRSDMKLANIVNNKYTDCELGRYFEYGYEAVEYYRTTEPWNMYELLTIDEFLS